MDVRTGRVQIHGVAFGGANAVAGVEVSTDGGQSWTKAGFVGPDFGRFAWRPFVLPAKLEPGTYTIASRTTDTEGNEIGTASCRERVSSYVSIPMVTLP